MADASGKNLTPARAPAGLLPRILQSWWSPRRVVAGFRGMPDRALLVVLMAAMLIFLVAQLPENARAAYLDPEIPLSARMAGSAMAVMFMMPLLAYGLAALVAALSRLTGRVLSGPDSRLALFWALLAIAPAMLLSGLVAGLIGPSPALTVTRGLTGLGFLLIWGAGITALVRR